jgi:hypothetical protein
MVFEDWTKIIEKSGLITACCFSSNIKKTEDFLYRLWVMKEGEKKKEGGDGRGM